MSQWAGRESFEVISSFFWAYPVYKCVGKTGWSLNTLAMENPEAMTEEGVAIASQVFLDFLDTAHRDPMNIHFYAIQVSYIK